MRFAVNSNRLYGSSVLYLTEHNREDVDLTKCVCNVELISVNTSMSDETLQVLRGFRGTIHIFLIL